LIVHDVSSRLHPKQVHQYSETTALSAVVSRLQDSKID